VNDCAKLFSNSAIAAHALQLIDSISRALCFGPGRFSVIYAAITLWVLFRGRGSGGVHGSVAKWVVDALSKRKTAEARRVPGFPNTSLAKHLSDLCDSHCFPILGYSPRRKLDNFGG
jgi:hypothetical protein